MVAVDGLARNEAVAGAGDDDPLIFQAFEAVHGPDVHPVGTCGAVGADFDGVDAVVGEPPDDVVDVLLGGDADGGGAVGGVAPGVELADDQATLVNIQP